ncbi:MAG: RsmD family RNA methyltransferase [Phycisphaerales bacterium]
MHSRLRIMGGEHRSRPLEIPPGFDITRPMTGRVKESLFNILRGWFEGATVVDLFAGVGTMGLEAASHGAARVVMVERDHEVLSCLERNIQSLGCGGRCTALQADALSPTTLARLPQPVDVVFMDPPYDLAEQTSGRRRILEQAARLRSNFGAKGWLVLRLPYALPAEEAHLPGFSGPEVRSYGEMHVHLYMPMEAS